MKKVGDISPTIQEIARMEVLDQSGVSISQISKETNFSRGTVRTYLNSDLYRDDEEFKIIVQAIKDHSLKDCQLLVAKARTRLHERLDDDTMKPIELIAAADRFFQQGQILSGGVTENININSFTETSEEREKRIKELKKKLEE